MKQKIFHNSLKNTEILEIDKNSESPLHQFAKTLTEEDKKLGISKWSFDNKYNYIVALFDFQLQRFQSLADCVLKCQILFSNMLISEKIDKFELKTSFKGTIENIKNENFHFIFSKIENVKEYRKLKDEQTKEIDLFNNIVEEEINNLFKQENEESDIEDNLEKNSEDQLPIKFDLLINQKDVVMNIYNEIKEKMPGLKDDDVCLATSGFLIASELASISNLSSQVIFFENLIKNNIPSNLSYEVKVLKNNLRYELTNTSKINKSFH